MATPINISASRGAAILGLSKWKTPVQTWIEIMEARQPGFCEKNNYELPVFEYNAVMRWGHAFEDAVIELSEQKSGYKITDRERYYTFIEYITCHIDGEYFIPKTAGITQLHEGKTASYFYWKDNFGEPGTDKIPIEYQIQCQHQMICTGAEKVILSVLVFPKRVEEWEEMGWEIIHSSVAYPLGCYLLSNKNIQINPFDWAKTLDQMGYFHQYEINAHPELQKNMIEKYTEFWNNYIIPGKEPIPQTYDDIKALCREPLGTIIADENIERLMAEYKNIKSEISGSGPLSKRTEQIKVQVLNYMRKEESTLDDDTTDKWILRNRQGQKIGSYGKNKKGSFVFR